MCSHNQQEHLEIIASMFYTVFRGAAFAVVYGCSHHPYTGDERLPPFIPAALLAIPISFYSVT